MALINFTESNYCTTDYWNESGKCKLALYHFDDSTTYTVLSKRCSKYNKIDGCTDSSKLQIPIQEYNIQMAITANFVGFTLVFGIALLFIMQGKK